MPLQMLHSILSLLIMLFNTVKYPNFAYIILEMVCDLCTIYASLVRRYGICALMKNCGGNGGDIELRFPQSPSIKRRALPLSLSTIWWNHFHCLYLLSGETTSTVSIYYLVKPLPLSLSTIWWNHFHCLYLLSGETTSIVSIYYLVKPLPLSLSTIWWNHFHCLYLLSGETTSTVSIYYLVKPLPLFLFII